MKKLMIAAAAIAFASVVNAAAVQWTVGALQNSPDNTKITTTSGEAVGYLFAAAMYDTVTGELAKGDLSSITGEKYLSTQPSVNGRGASSITGVTGNILSAGNALDAFVVILDASAPDSANNYAYSAVMTSAKAGDGGNVVWNMGNFAAITAGEGASGGWQAVAVPEPTSGLLLLLGVAGLALRRRRA